MFLAAAEAALGVMIEHPEAISGQEHLSFQLENEELDMLLFDFLQEIIYYKDARRLLLRIVSLQIDLKSTPFTLTANAAGETMIQGHHPLLTDVKAVTLYRLAVKRDKKGWQATVVLDV
ncbi:MAG: archease [Geobacteraceae bacterium]|nr:archease [Geobacteraceae bacterium]